MVYRLFFALIIVVSSLASQEKETLLIWDFEPKNGITKEEAEVLTDTINNYVFQQKRFKITRKKDYSSEYFTGLDNNNSPSILAIGQKLGVQKILTGTISQLENHFQISGRILKTSNGEIERTASITSTHLSYTMGEKFVSKLFSESLPIPIDKQSCIANEDWKWDGKSCQRRNSKIEKRDTAKLGNKIYILNLYWDTEAYEMDWYSAMEYCKSKGMRLPTKEELISAYHSWNKTLRKPAYYYWSSSVYVNNTYYAWIVNTNYGYTNFSFKEETSYYARCVMK